MTAKVLMIQGTMSSAGKSWLVTGLCRLYARRGIRTAPFKAQNMSNNAGVCIDGAEIGRAQYTQALACGTAPSAEMNPILLKPQADAESQVILMGKPFATLSARQYYQKSADFWTTITKALDQLRSEYELIIVEGAGSPVELNLKQGDLVNMSVAKYSSSPVMLVGDIDRGGIFAQLLGTLWLLEPEERDLIKGLVVNKFRGDVSLFSDGIKLLEEKGEIPVLGVIPMIHHRIPDEDAVSIEQGTVKSIGNTSLEIVIIRLPRIANFDEFDALDAETGVSVRYIDSASEFGNPDAVIIPGTKSTIADLLWLKRKGLDTVIQGFADHKGPIVGICGGYQMLGKSIRDPNHYESEHDQAAGLGLLPTETDFNQEKATHQTQALILSDTSWLNNLKGKPVFGYEIHMGETQHLNETNWLEFTRRGEEAISIPDGSISQDGRIWGCYLHGIFYNEAFRHAWLKSIGWEITESAPSENLFDSFDLVADHLEESFNVPYLDGLLGI